MESVQKILLVDDEPSVLNALRRLFRRTGYQIHTAGSAIEGLKLFEQVGPFHLVITDYRMPEMNGVEFLRQVKKRWPDTVRMVLSGYADTDVIIAATNEGHIYKFISKPWDEDFLLQSVAEGLERYSKKVLLQNQQLLLSKELERLRQEGSATMQEVGRKQLPITAVYQSLLDQIPVGVLGIDCFGDIVCMNTRARELFDLAETPVGESVCHLLPAFCTKMENCLLLQQLDNMVLDVKGKTVRLKIKKFHQHEGFVLMQMLLLMEIEQGVGDAS